MWIPVAINCSQFKAISLCILHHCHFVKCLSLALNMQQDLQDLQFPLFTWQHQRCVLWINKHVSMITEYSFYILGFQLPKLKLALIHSRGDCLSFSYMYVNFHNPSQSYVPKRFLFEDIQNEMYSSLVNWNQKPEGWFTCMCSKICRNTYHTVEWEWSLLITVHDDSDCSIHVCSVIETRQSKATAPKDNSYFLKRKGRAASGEIWTCNILCTRQMLYQLSLYMQTLSWSMLTFILAPLLLARTSSRLNLISCSSSVTISAQLFMTNFMSSPLSRSLYAAQWRGVSSSVFLWTACNSVYTRE